MARKHTAENGDMQNRKFNSYGKEHTLPFLLEQERNNTMATTYKSPDYDDKKYRSGVNTDYYTKAVDAYRKQQEQNRATQLAAAQKTQQSALKQAYITRLQNQQKLQQGLATSGIRGGATETANIRLANQYGLDRNNANTNYTNSVNDINRSIDQNISDYQSDMESRAEEYRQNMAQAKWQADREDSLNEYNSVADYWNNYYMDYYSGAAKKNLDKYLKKAKTNYKKAKTDSAKLRYLQQIRAIQARRGVIANK